ncbi:sel1 repeat family protein [Pseudoalteromonas sp. MMG005]|uniref:sel1 repeat family protein n=1 Tax=Pseudoalteromonas sp. MMG005 TaxID=2822682 RepID=UPI001B3A6F76|nr:sel1 repeat family protein [Pseudoalteromonas sp. MMG005]MBQ4845878.1 sel1 repeat family protein [Pseudoalteromonas sp. MMG005]
MEKSQLDNAASHDLEQQLLNVLEFVTAPINSEARLPEATDTAQAYKKGLYYLKEQSYPLAAKWIRLAAMSGDTKAQFYLGLLFIKGQGVPQSAFHGMAWLVLAQSQGVAAAQEMIKQVKPHLTTKRIKDAQCYAATLYEQIHQLQFLSPEPQK